MQTQSIEVWQVSILRKSRFLDFLKITTDGPPISFRLCVFHNKNHAYQLRFFFVKYDPDFVCVLSGQRVPTDKHWTMENPSLFIFTAWDRHEFQHKSLIAQNPHVNLLSPQRKASTSETLNCLHPNLHRIHSSNHSIIITHPAGCSKSKPGIAASFLEIIVTVRSPTIPEHWKRHQHRES